MSEYIATAVCYFALGFGVALTLAGYWLHSEHVEWKKIVDKYADLIDKRLSNRAAGGER